jgi:hypothetical protein
MKKDLISIKHATILAGSALLTTLALLSTAAIAGPHKHGTDILHYSVQARMTNEGILTNATGQVSAQQNEQGNANHQNLDITAKGLDSGAGYKLLVAFDDQTNLTEVVDFTSDAKGRANLHYRNFGNGNGSHGHSALPPGLEPVSHIRELSIFNSSTQAVLTADLASPDRLQYLIKRDLSTTNGVDATLRIQANNQKTQFRLTASGLSASSDYLLALNGGVVQTNSTNAKGQLAINSLLVSPGDFLNVRSLALWDSASNVILSTTLP